MQSISDVILNILVWPYVLARFVWRFLVYRADCPRCGYRVKRIFGNIIHSTQECERNKASSRHYNHVFKWFVHNKKTFDLKSHLTYHRQPDASVREALTAFIARLLFDFLVIVTIASGWLGALLVIWYLRQWLFQIRA